MKSVKGNADRQQDVEVRWMIDDADSGEEPLEIFQQEVSVFEKPEHAQVHAEAGNQPRATRRRLSRRNIITRQKPSLRKDGNRPTRSRISRLKPRQRTWKPPKPSRSRVIWKSRWPFFPSSRIWNFIPVPISRRWQSLV